ncbi:MAG: radical SAM protein [Oscillospiraceae bacterium]
MTGNPLTACLLCPRRCGVDRTAGERGFCGAGERVRAARAAPHLWEEPCISGTRGAGTVFFSSCTLGCVFCQNAQISHHAEGIELTTEQLTEVFLRLAACGVHNLELVTPTQFAPQIIEAVAQARERGMHLPILYNCGGYELPETIRLLADTVDVWMPDFKYADGRAAARYSGAADYPEVAQTAIDEMLALAGPPQYDAEGLLIRGVLVRHLLLPGLLADSLHAVKQLWERYGDDVVLSLMSQYTPMPFLDGARFPALTRTVNPRHYEALCTFAAELGITRCYLQEGASAGPDCIPAFDGTGIL